MNPQGAPAAPEGAQGLIASIKAWWESLNLEKTFGSSSSEAIHVAIYFVSFFAVGFLFKKYLKYLFWSIVISLLIIKGLEFYKILDIDGEALNTILGLEPTATVGTVTNNAFEWIKVNVVIAVASTLGFLIGYKLG